MSDDTPAPASHHAKEEAVSRLSEAFAGDRLDVDEFERRVELVHEATTADELRRLLSDLPSGGRAPVPTRPDDDDRYGGVRGSDRSEALARPGDARLADVHRSDHSLVMGALGGAVRKGRWVPARSTTAIGIMGGVELDLRDAVLGPGVTEIKCFAFWGGVDIVVPPDVSVECDGIGILGGFEHRHEAELLADPDRPVIRIRGVAIMGGVDVSARYPGESARDARRRLKEERKERRRLEGGR